MNNRTMLLTCYRDIRDYGWRHVDLFVHDAEGKEVNWVHWGAAEEGPDGADAATRLVEPLLRRTSEWRHGIRADGSDYWTARAEWVGEHDRTAGTTTERNKDHV